MRDGLVPGLSIEGLLTAMRKPIRNACLGIEKHD